MPCTRDLLQSVQTFVESHYLTRQFTATFRQTQKNILIEVRLNKSLVYIKMTRIQITLTRNRIQKSHTRTRHNGCKRLTIFFPFALLKAASLHIPVHQPSMCKPISRRFDFLLYRREGAGLQYTVEFPVHGLQPYFRMR